MSESEPTKGMTQYAGFDDNLCVPLVSKPEVIATTTGTPTDEWLILIETNDGKRSGIHKIDGEWYFEGDPKHFLWGLRDSEMITQRVNQRRIAELEAEVERLREVKATLRDFAAHCSLGLAGTAYEMALLDRVHKALEECP